MKKLRIKRQANLWQYFVIIVLGILVMTSVVMYVIIFSAINTNLLVRLEFSLPFAISTILAISILMGTIQMESESGQGSAFTIQLPNHKQHSRSGFHFERKSYRL